MTVDGDDDLAILVDDKAGETLCWCFYLPSKERTAIVGKRPTELKIFSDQPFGRGIAGYGLVCYL